MDADLRAGSSTTAYPDNNIKPTVDADGILLARIDMPGRVMNVFSLDMMDSLERLLDHVDATDAVKAVVIASAKPTFVVGADLAMIRRFVEEARTGTHDALHALCGRLGRLFRRLERSTKAYVAAINGLALGGGLEVTLACHARVVVGGDTVHLGLPEIKLGLLPGAGGTQRLPRLIDAGEAMRMLLTGDPISPARALQLGLIHEVVAPDHLIEAARRRALALSHPRAPWDIPGRTFDSAPFDFSDKDALVEIAAFVRVTDYQRAKYPAYDAIMECVTGGWNQPMDEACRLEMDVFVDLIRNPVAGNMVRTLFLNRQRAVKEGQPPKSLSTARVAVAGSDAETIRALLDQGKAPIIDISELTDQDIAVVAGDAGTVAGRRIAWLRDHEDLAPSHNAPAGLWLADPSEHGLVAEIVIQNGNEEQADAGRKLAQWLRATVLVTRGGTAFLPVLKAAQSSARNAGCSEGEVVLAVALAAARAWLAGVVADVEIADVAAVLSGMHPAYTGGPFNYLRQMGAARIQAKAAEAAQRPSSLFSVPAGSQDLFKALPEAG
jgi:3-hydroxyacyl-CoA dehydrogenase/enoyl-CoA hydratase/3-hydroxybutyryl-CoA epimerase